MPRVPGRGRAAFRAAWRALFALMTAACVAPGPAAAQWDDRTFLAELRRRGMWELAESFCTDRLADPALSPEESADLVCQWIQMAAERALATRWERRDPVWDAWTGAVETWKADHAGHPRMVLMEVQQALAVGARGHLERQEAEVFGREDLREQARVHLREAVEQLAAVNEQLDRLLREQYRTTQRRPGEFTAQELLALRQQVELDRAKAHLQQALSYASGSTDRTAALAQARQELAPLAALQAAAPGSWEAAVLEVTCLRLEGKTGTALRKRDQLAQLEPPDPWPGHLEAERLRLLAESGHMDQATRLAADRSAWGRCAERDLAALEILLADGSLETVSETAAALAEVIGQAYPPHWQRQVDLLLSNRLTAPPATPAASLGSSLDQAQLLGRAAAGLAQQGQVHRAAESYRQAAREAAALGRTDQAVEWLWQAAGLELQQKQFGPAEEIYYELAQSFLNHPRASQAHLMSIYCLAQLARDAPEYVDLYAERLAEHLRTWSRGSTTDQARHWLAKLCMARNDWNGAVEALAFLSAEYPELPQAIQDGATCYDRLLDEAPSDAARQELAIGAAGFFERFVLGAEGQVPERWAESARQAAVQAARYRLLYVPDGADSARRLLTAALSETARPAPSWYGQAQGLLAVCMAMEGDWPAAHKAAGEITGERPEALLGAANQLWELARQRSAAERPNWGALGQTLVERLGEEPERLVPAQRAQWQRNLARFLALQGKVDEADQAYQQLLESLPDRLALRQEYARWLGQLPAPRYAGQAQEQWRQVVEHAAKDSPAWWEGKYEIARLHQRQGEPQRALEMIQLLEILMPEMGGPLYRQRFEQLRDRCRAELP